MTELENIEDLQRLVVSGETNWKQYGDVNYQIDGDLILFDYAQKAQFANRWNWFERHSRGLILNRVTGEVVAYPFEKFFNWFEGGRKASGYLVCVTEKADGSMGTLFRKEGRYRIATRGNMRSEQALWATEFLNSHYDLTGLDDAWTLIFEIIYPANRIVVDYGNLEDLVLLAIRNRHTGDYLPYTETLQVAQQYGFSHPKIIPFANVLKIIEAAGAIDADQEGWVALFSDGSRWKFKGDRYKELHKLISGLTFKNVVKAMASNTLDHMLNAIPDEFLEEAQKWIAEINQKVSETLAQCQAVYQQAPSHTDQKTFALWVMQDHKDISSYLFSLYKGDDIVPMIYEREFK